MQPLDKRLIVGNAAEEMNWPNSSNSIDLVVSDGVFEHIPRQDLTKLIDVMADKLSKDGIAIIKPMVFTGIAGGHDLEWYPYKANQEIHRRSSPWEHLRQNRYPADTYLNCLTRQEYRDLFRRRFEILEEEVTIPWLGAKFMTREIRQELSNLSDDELFSNEVAFVLRVSQ